MTDHKLNPQEVKQFSEVFEMYDEAGTEKVNIDKVGAMMNSMGWNATAAEITNCRKAAKFEDGCDLTLDMYLTFMGVWTSLKPPKHSDDALRDAFKVFDKKGTGSVPGEVFKYIMMGCGEPLSEQEMTELMREADTDGDGNIDFEEFVALMRGGVTIQF